MAQLGEKLQGYDRKSEKRVRVLRQFHKGSNLGGLRSKLEERSSGLRVVVGLSTKQRTHSQSAFPARKD